MGDPAGVGGEIVLLTWLKFRDSLPPFYIFDDPNRLKELSRVTGLGVPVIPVANRQEALVGVFSEALPVVPLSRSVNTLPGMDSTSEGDMVIEAIDRAIDAASSGQAAGMVTNPINKNRLYSFGFSSPGHTEYLGQRAGLKDSPVMLIVSQQLKVVPVTIHLSLADAIQSLTKPKIIRTLRLTIAGLKSDFGILKPRIAVSGLNPHAGENGKMGREEIDIIAPAIKEFSEDDAMIFGPLAGDTMFHDLARQKYDVAICMYHDQALIPIKTLDFDNGVNVSLGLPFVRTSPDHGTAYDIAGTGSASPKSLVSAIKLASQLAKNREGKTLEETEIGAK